MTESTTATGSKLCPHVAQYAPYLAEGLLEGEVRYWCRCGLSKTQPWCDSSHMGTGIAPLKWKVPVTQEKYYLCGCKHTDSPPLCDGRHCNIALEVEEHQKNCENKEKHVKGTKLCTSCGAIDF